MANEKLITLELLEYFKGKLDTDINAGDALSVKAIDFADNKLKFYKTEDKSDTPIEIGLPEELYLDQTKTQIVESFAWSETTYPGSANPNLEGEPVLVFAVKGDKAVTYSFLGLRALVDVFTGKDTTTATTAVSDVNEISVAVKVSSVANNSIVVKNDGLYAPIPEAPTLTYASNEDIDNMFA